MPTPIYYLSVESRGVAHRVGIDNAPLAADPNAAGLTQVRSINEWVHPGRNRLTVLLYQPVRPRTDPDAPPPTPPPAEVTATVFTADPAKESPEPGAVLARFTWPTPGVPVRYPHPAAVPFELPPADSPPAKLWSQADRLTMLTPADHAAILDQVEAFRAALLVPDPAAAYSLSSHKYEDEAVAYAKPLDPLRDTVLQQYGWIRKLTGASSRPLQLPEALFEIVADSRLALVSRGMDDAVVIDSAKYRFRIPVFCARINGKWRIAR